MDVCIHNIAPLSTCFCFDVLFLIIFLFYFYIWLFNFRHSGSSTSGQDRSAESVVYGTGMESIFLSLACKFHNKNSCGSSDIYLFCSYKHSCFRLFGIFDYDHDGNHQGNQV